MDFIKLLLDKIEPIDKNKYKNSFKLPIELIDNKVNINENIIEDLELKKFKFLEEDNNIVKKNLYYNLLSPEFYLEEKNINNWANYYTNDINYLEDTQNLLEMFKPNVNINLEEDRIIKPLEKYNKIYTNYEEIINNNNFIENYQYIDLPFLQKYNNDKKCMFCLSLYNLSSPLLSLLIPIICLILPFFIIKLQGYNISLKLYFNHLKIVFSNHIIGRLFSDFKDAPFSTKIYLLLSIIFYLFQIYQNIYFCKKYFTNIKYINNKLIELREYINETIKSFNNYLKYSENFSSYNKFNKTIINNRIILEDYYEKLKPIKNYKLHFSKIFELGDIMKNFYILYDNNSIVESLYFSFDYNTYIQNIIEIQKLIKSKKINKCNFIKNEKNKNTKFTNAYYCNLIDDNKIVKNSYNLNNNLILTGPNAAGKTTLLKTTLFNIILCQQIGYGFFDDAEIKIYDFIHCYINIPDTSNRDSLFQAEAKQCKKILDFIEENSNKNHLCVFDELFSGTNPDEAVKSGYGYLKHINRKNVNFILTSHYYKLCKMLEKQDSKIKNYHMEIKKSPNNEDFNFTYKLKKGISKVKGGIKVLNDLQFPESIIKEIE